MRSRIIESGTNFTPVTVELTFESQDELDGLAALSNIDYVCRALEVHANMNLAGLRETLRNAGGIASGPMHRNLVNHIKEDIKKTDLL